MTRLACDYRRLIRVRSFDRDARATHRYQSLLRPRARKLHTQVRHRRHIYPSLYPL